MKSLALTLLIVLLCLSSVTFADDSIDGFVFVGKKTYSCGGQKHTVKEYRHIETKMDFVLLPGNDKIKPFLMSKYEVPQVIWKSVMGNNPSHFKGLNKPVEQISWINCQQFCTKTGLSLPTSAQWEYAYRAGTDTLYYWGNEPCRDYMWYSAKEPTFNRQGETHPIGQKKPNAFGLYDMSGNVWEWCLDKYEMPRWRIEHERKAQRGSWYVFRGGSFYNPAQNCRVVYKFGDAWNYKNADLGFRVCKNIK